MSQDAMEPPQQRAPTPSPTRDPVVGALEEKLGLPLVNPEVALAAVTHKSFVNEHRGEGLRDNERLEFLGDAVIDLAVSHRLMQRFPDAREGELSKIRAAVVDEAGLARMARELDLGPLLRLGRGEELTGGRQKSSLLADAMEAVIAAIYLGGGLEPVLAVIDRFLGDAFARAAAGTLDRDYKTQLQELAQSRLRVSPRYRVVAEHGPDHSKVFEVELELKGDVIGRGVGRSKKDAEQAAAKLAMERMTERLGVTPAPSPACEALAAAEARPVAAEPVEVAPPAALAPDEAQAEPLDAAALDAPAAASEPAPGPPADAAEEARPAPGRKPRTARKRSTKPAAGGRTRKTVSRRAPTRRPARRKRSRDPDEGR
jgi:ribonuclease-3